MLAVKIISSIENLLHTYESTYGADLCVAVPIDYAIASNVIDDSANFVYMRYVCGVYPDKSTTHDCIDFKITTIQKAVKQSTSDCERNHFKLQHRLLREIKSWLDAFYVDDESELNAQLHYGYKKNLCITQK